MPVVLTVTYMLTLPSGQVPMHTQGTFRSAEECQHVGSVIAGEIRNRGLNPSFRCSGGGTAGGTAKVAKQPKDPVTTGSIQPAPKQNTKTTAQKSPPPTQRVTAPRTQSTQSSTLGGLRW